MDPERESWHEGYSKAMKDNPPLTGKEFDPYIQEIEELQVENEKLKKEMENLKRKRACARCGHLCPSCTPVHDVDKFYQD